MALYLGNEKVSATSILQGEGIALPELTNPAVANDIAYGKEVIDGEGNVVTGIGTIKKQYKVTISGTASGNRVVYRDSALEGIDISWTSQEIMMEQNECFLLKCIYSGTLEGDSSLFNILAIGNYWYVVKFIGTNDASITIG